jgi:ABC-type lipoprotein export system ATPase subunit
MSEAIVARDLFRVHSTPEGDAAALQGLTLTVPERQLLAVVGPSGSGKTTLLRILAGLDRPSAGSVRVFGQDVAKLKRRALAAYRSRNVGYLDQHYGAALDPRLDARALVALRLRLAGASAREAERGARELLERVGLNGRSAAHASELSGGEQQRVAVCAALAHRPRLLLADEPTGELDRDNADSIFALIQELAADYGTTVLVVTHDPTAARFADRAVRIRDGRVSEELRAAGADQIVVGRGGWLRLPEELLREAGIREHAEAELAGSDLRIRAVGGPDLVAQSHKVPGPLSKIPSGVAAQARGLTKVYGEGDTARVVLDGFDARFERGSLYAVTGPSGSGKTTLLNLLAGLERPTSGTVLVDGRELTELDRAGRAAVRRDAVGYVAQQPTLFPFLSARENVELALTLRGRLDASALEILTAVGLAERAEQRVERLSAGERLRAAIARALVVEPALLLADEPTSRLDEANAAAIAELLGRLAREVGAAVVCASHDPVVLDRADEQISLA